MDDNSDDSQSTARAIKRQTVDMSKSKPQGIFLHFLDQCPLISCDLILPKCEPLPPPFLYTFEAAEDVEFTGDDDAESLPLPPPPPPLIVDTHTSPRSPTTAGFSTSTMGGTNGTTGGWAEDDRLYIGNDSQLPARRKRRKTQGVESLIVQPHLRDTEGAVKDITYFDEAAGHSDDDEAAGYLDDDQAAGGSWRTTAVNEALQQYEELHKVEMRRKEEEHVKQIRRKDEEIYRLQAKVIALHDQLLQPRSQPRSVGVGQAD